MKTSIVLLLYLLHLVRAFLAASSSVTFHVLVFRVPTSEEITATRSCIIASPFCASVFLFPFPFLSRVLFAPRSLVFFLSNPRSCRSSGTSTPFERLRATARALLNGAIDISRIFHPFPSDLSNFNDPRRRKKNNFCQIHASSFYLARLVCLIHF